MLFRLGWMLLLTAGQLDTQVNFYSDIDLFGFGTQFQPANTVELISVTFASSLSDCGLKCNLNVQYRTFDYDAGSSVCRLFEGAVDTGQVLATGSSTSRTGAVRLGKNLFANYGQPCTQCLQSRYLTCSSNNTCQCPPNTAWDSTACVNQAYEDASCLTNRWCRQDRGFVCSNLQFCTKYVCGNMTIAKADLPNNDLTSTQTGNYSSCCLQCQTYSGCRAFSWVSSPGAFYGMCYLKSSTGGGGTPSVDHISAYY